jgi:AraC-like DNA-binding protein
VAPGWVDNVFTVHHVNICWGIKGTGGITVDEQRVTLGPEQIFIFMPGMTQELYALDEPWEYCWWTVDGPLAEKTVRGFGLREGIHNAGPAPLSYISALESIIQGPGYRNEINASALAFQLLSVAAQYHGTEPDNPSASQMVESATNAVLASWQDPDFSVNRLARELGVNRSILSRRFRKTTGTTLVNYIASVRLQNAVAMLRETTLSIAEIASQCGYSDPNYFSKIMHARLGVPPTEFRKAAADSPR